MGWAARTGAEFRMSAIGERIMSLYSWSCGSRQMRSPDVSIALLSLLRSFSSSHQRPAKVLPRATTTPPVSVAMSMMAAGFSLSHAQQSASASTSRPSASVLVTSTVTPLRKVMMSSGR